MEGSWEEEREHRRASSGYNPVVACTAVGFAVALLVASLVRGMPVIGDGATLGTV